MGEILIQWLCQAWSHFRNQKKLESKISISLFTPMTSTIQSSIQAVQPGNLSFKHFVSKSKLIYSLIRLCPLHICLAWRGRRAVLVTWLIAFEGCFLTLPHLSQSSGAFPVLRNLWNSVCRFPSASGVLSLKSLWCDCTNFSNYFLPPSSNWWQFRGWNNFRITTLQAFFNNPAVPSTRSSPRCLLRRLLSSRWHPPPVPTVSLASCASVIASSCTALSFLPP